jgi:hypothetical protein
VAFELAKKHSVELVQAIRQLPDSGKMAALESKVDVRGGRDTVAFRVAQSNGSALAGLLSGMSVAKAVDVLHGEDKDNAIANFFAWLAGPAFVGLLSNMSAAQIVDLLQAKDENGVTVAHRLAAGADDGAKLVELLASPRPRTRKKIAGWVSIFFVLGPMAWVSEEIFERMKIHFPRLQEWSPLEGFTTEIAASAWREVVFRCRTGPPQPGEGIWGPPAPTLRIAPLPPPSRMGALGLCPTPALLRYPILP